MRILKTTFLQHTVALSLVLPALASAQVPDHLNRLEIAIWPEYDRPEALVMLRAWLPPDRQLPTTVSLPMPASVAIPNAVAKRNPDGQLMLALHTLELRDEVRMVHVETDFPEVRVEYYAPLSTGQPDRSFSFHWPGGVDIDDLSYEIQVPAAVTDLQISPPSDQQQTGFDGLAYHRASLGPRSSSSALSIDVEYTKLTQDLTIASLQPQPPQGIPSGAAGESPLIPSSSDSRTWLFILPIALLAGLVVLWFALSRPRSKDA